MTKLWHIKVKRLTERWHIFFLLAHPFDAFDFAPPPVDADDVSAFHSSGRDLTQCMSRPDCEIRPVRTPFEALRYYC